ncbi:MAG: CopD family protein [Polyangiaceae bacterium]
MEPHPLFELRDVVFQYVGFLASFLVLGPLGFRYGVVRRGVGAPGLTDGALARAAKLGLLGVGLAVVSLVAGLLKRAAAKHLSVSEVFHAGGAASYAQVVLLGVLAVAFALAARGVARAPASQAGQTGRTMKAGPAWGVASVAGGAYALRELLSGRLAAMINPLHVLGASLWIGTLFVLVVCGIGVMLSPGVPPAERESAVATMVRRFSVLALSAAGLLGVTGVWTAWTHLKRVDSLWTTPYGYVLDAKLCVVLGVAALGAWNWRKVGPALGKDGGALTIRRTATMELALAALVLALTAILVSVPGPK